MVNVSSRFSSQKAGINPETFQESGIVGLEHEIHQRESIFLSQPKVPRNENLRTRIPPAGWLEMKYIQMTKVNLKP